MKRFFDKRLLVGLVIGFALCIGFIYVFKGNLFDRGIRVFNRSSPYVFGLDVSHYQEKINWDKVTTAKHPIKFVFIRASMGIDGVDEQFDVNWKSCKEKKLIRGAYHYFRPNQDPTKQFALFKQRVILRKGDLPPVLDVEVMSKDGSAKLLARVKVWLKLAEEHYKIKPILYTGSKFYRQNFKGKIEGYPLWIAAYSGKNRLIGLDWTFHQFSERVRVSGIKGFADGNDYRGSIEQLQKMTLK